MWKNPWGPKAWNIYYLVLYWKSFQTHVLEKRMHINKNNKHAQKCYFKYEKQKHMQRMAEKCLWKNLTSWLLPEAYLPSFTWRFIFLTVSPTQEVLSQSHNNILSHSNLGISCVLIWIRRKLTQQSFLYPFIG